MEYNTFKEAAKALNLLIDDNEWDKALSDAALFAMPVNMRQLFAYICIFGTPNNARELWEAHKDAMIEDYIRHHDNDTAVNIALNDIQSLLALHRKSNSDFSLPVPRQVQSTAIVNFVAEEEKQFAEQNIPNLNEGQKRVFDRIISAIDDERLEPRCFYCDGIGGSGKTFTYKVILSFIRGRGEIALASATTGIAANLLKGGTTVHSLFKLPVPFNDRSVCSFRGKSAEKDRIKAAKLILIDEATMLTAMQLNAIDKFLKEIMNSSKPFGNKVLLLGGDWRQCLPVIKHGNRTTIMENCLKKSKTWRFFEQLRLTENMRTEPDQLEFANWLLKLGNGELILDGVDGRAEMPSDLICHESLVDEIFGKEFTELQAKEFCDRAILCPKNDDTLRLNYDVLQCLQGEERAYYSIDSAECEDESESINYPLEFLHSLTPSGIPPHVLKLKVGAIIMLLRNLNTNQGLCNGTRLIIKNLANNLIYAEILTGSGKGNTVFIPRIDLKPSDSDLPFKLKRRQFPVLVSFAMTINKSQGQTFERVGIFLPMPVFAHGQLYVAFSRATSARKVSVKILESEQQGRISEDLSVISTTNVVYKEVFE